MAPISPRGSVPEHKFLLEAATDPRRRPRDFAGNEVFPPARRFVIVKNSVADKKAVGLAVNPCQLGRKSLRATVGAGRPERRLFRLRRVGRVAKYLPGTRVVEDTRRCVNT